MRKNRVVFAAGVIAAVALSVTACSTPSTGGSAAPTASGNKLLGIVSITANEAGNALAIKGATAAAEAAGWKVEVVDAQGNADTANAAFRNFVNKKAGMIFDLVFPASSLGAGLSAARQAGIPVASWGGGTGDGIVMNTGDGGPFSTIVTNSLAEDMQGKGEVLALTYHGGQVCIDREKAFDAVLAKNPGIKVTKEEVTIPGFLQDGARYATSWLASRPAGSENLAVWGCWDDPTLGAISALKQLKRSDVKTYGIAGSVTAIQAVKDGSMTATAYEDGTAEGKTMFETTLQAIKAGSSWKPKTANVDGTLVNKSTIDKFLSDHPDILK
jgi:ribose transport system substrate-binding protein